jgi:ArsR family transcriptional regulator
MIAQPSIFEMQAQLCQAMSNPLRVELVHLLQDGPSRVSELIEATGQHQSTVSRNLIKLKNAGLVSSRRVGQEVVYEIKNPTISEVCNLMRQVLLEEATQRANAFRSEVEDSIS